MSYPADIFHGNNFEDVIPTAEELLKKYENTVLSIEDVMIEFAKLHVEAALKAASENVITDVNWLREDLHCLDVGVDYEVYAIQSSITDVYPLDNIK